MPSIPSPAPPGRLEHTREVFRTRTGFWALCERETVRILRIWKQTIAGPIMYAVLLLGVFGASLGTRIGSIDGATYIAYIVPGIVLMQVATMAYNNNSSSVYQGKSDGYIEDILAAPMHPWQVSVAMLWGGVLRSFIVTGCTLAAAAFMTPLEVAHPFLAMLLVLLVSILWGAIGVIAGVMARTFEDHTTVSNLVLMPLIFVGGVFYSVEMLPDNIAWLTRLDPLFYQVNGMRYAFLGTADTGMATALVSTAALAACAFAIQVWMFVTGFRLKD